MHGRHYQSSSPHPTRPEATYRHNRNAAADRPEYNQRTIRFPRWGCLITMIPQMLQHCDLMNTDDPTSSSNAHIYSICLMAEHYFEHEKTTSLHKKNTAAWLQALGSSGDTP